MGAFHDHIRPRYSNRWLWLRPHWRNWICAYCDLLIYLLYSITWSCKANILWENGTWRKKSTLTKSISLCMEDEIFTKHHLRRAEEAVFSPCGTVFIGLDQWYSGYWFIKGHRTYLLIWFSGILVPNDEFRYWEDVSNTGSKLDVKERAQYFCDLFSQISKVSGSRISCG